jgi:hypothetical protein
MIKEDNNILSWTIQTIREDDGLASWLEERKYEWVPLVSDLLSRLLSEDSQTVIIITDKEYEWFGKYILSHINSKKQNRPYLPFVHIKSYTDNLDNIQGSDDIELLKDMLNITFKNNYIFWYIGSSDNQRANIAKHTKGSFLWLFDQQMQNSFYLSSTDKIIDIKLLQLFRLFNKTLSAALFDEIEY